MLRTFRWVGLSRPAPPHPCRAGPQRIRRECFGRRSHARRSACAACGHFARVKRNTHLCLSQKDFLSFSSSCSSCSSLERKRNNDDDDVRMCRPKRHKRNARLTACWGGGNPVPLSGPMRLKTAPPRPAQEWPSARRALRHRRRLQPAIPGGRNCANSIPGSAPPTSCGSRSAQETSSRAGA